MRNPSPSNETPTKRLGAEVHLTWFSSHVFSNRCSCLCFRDKPISTKWMFWKSAQKRDDVILMPKLQEEEPIQNIIQHKSSENHRKRSENRSKRTVSFFYRKHRTIAISCPSSRMLLSCSLPFQQLEEDRQRDANQQALGAWRLRRTEAWIFALLLN